MVIEGVPARVHEIEQRFSVLRSASGGAPSGQRLGFGLLLEQQRAEAVRADVAVQPSAASLLATSSLAALTPAVQLEPGAYGSLTPPPELVAFGNGRIPTAALAPVGDTGHRLWAPAATGLDRLLDDAVADGITIGITDSYRPIEVQERLAIEKGLYRDGGLAAVPGTSNHGWGLSTDLTLDDSALAWMRTNAWKYGFVEDVPREPWHWTYRPA